MKTAHSPETPNLLYIIRQVYISYYKEIMGTEKKYGNDIYTLFR